MHPAKILFHPITLLAVVLSTAGAFVPRYFNLGVSWSWAIGLLLALLPLLTAQWHAVYGDSTLPVDLSQFHMWVSVLTTMALMCQTMQTALATAPSNVTIPVAVTAVLATLYGVCNSAVNQLHLDEEPPPAPVAPAPPVTAP